MSKRDVGVLLFGIGVGLMAGCLAVANTLRWMRHMFLIEVHWQVGLSMALPWLFLAAGSVILYRQRRRS